MIQLLMAAATIWTKGEHRIFWHISRVMFVLWTLAAVFNLFGLNDATAPGGPVGWLVTGLFCAMTAVVAHRKLRGSMTEEWLQRAKIAFWVFCGYGALVAAFTLGVLNG